MEILRYVPPSLLGPRLMKIKIEHFIDIFFCKINIAMIHTYNCNYIQNVLSLSSFSVYIFFTTITICTFNGTFLIEAQVRYVSAFVITNNKIIARVIMPFRGCNVTVRAYYVNLMHYCIQLLMNYEIN